MIILGRGLRFLNPRRHKRLEQALLHLGREFIEMNAVMPPQGRVSILPGLLWDWQKRIHKALNS
jgi:hypothetical protein